ncbi:putative reverse transcriptase domain-containing protein [Tanacetum coccineum]|uniref:Reverse transcriptase domain-containing protein n=1 Tax=Tanacetum coccineum TaxID=301880 RepID=A0ABQ5IW75_9ASTR
MSSNSTPMTQAAIHQMIKESVDAAIAAERARQVNVRNDASESGPVRGRDTALAVCECTFAGFMKFNLAVFRGVEGAIELRRWFEKTENIFEISECAEGKKVKFAAATLEGPTLTWWKTKVATMGLETVNQMPWTEMKQLMTAEFFPIEEVQRLEHELWNLKVKEYDVIKLPQGGNVGIRQGPRSECGTGMFLLNNPYLLFLFDSGFDRSFVNTRFSSLLDIKPIKIDDSYEVELADGRIVSTNTVLKGCTLSLVNHVFEIDLMPIKLGTFDVIIGMDWLVKHDVVIFYGEKVVCIPYGNKTLIVEGDKGVSRLKVISCIKARNYVE